MFWGLIMEPNKRYTQQVEKSFHVSQAALDISSSDGEPVQVMVTFEKRNYLIATLQKGKNVQVPLDLNFEQGNVISFTSNGKSHVHLTGYLVADDLYDDLSEDDEEMDSEEVPELVPIKREKRKASTVGKDGPSSPKKTKASTSTPSVSNGTPNNKKIKTPELADLLNDTKDDDSSSEDDDFDPNNVTANTVDSEDEELEFDSDAILDELADDDDDEDDDNEDDDDEENEDDEDDNDDDDESEEEEVVEEKPKTKKDKKKDVKEKKVAPVQNGVESKKDKKKNSVSDNEKTKKTLTGGVAVEDLKVGNGNAAQSGKKVQVYYIGRLLSNNKVFDSTQKGPGFKFTLGKGEVIKGWDVGVAGMKVGGKRRITIPPQMAYGAKGSPPVIPANSTLVFEVELRNVH